MSLPAFSRTMPGEMSHSSLVYYNISTFVRKVRKDEVHEKSGARGPAVMSMAYLYRWQTEKYHSHGSAHQ